MKIYNNILAGTLTLMAFASCMSEDLESKFTAGGDKGTLELGVELLQPARRDVSTVNFPVVIKDASGSVVKEYATVAEVPASIVMAVGSYTVESHTPGEIAKSMSNPYYKGASDVEIVKDVTSPVNVVCKMANSQVNINYDEEFRNVFTAWEVTIDDGSETALSFTQSSTTNTIYWYFGEAGVKQLVVNFRGTTTTGNTIAARNVLTKNQSSTGGYDDDNTNFTGGDLITLNFAPTESTEGNITGITLSANVVFDETAEDVNVGVIDVPGLNDPTGGGDNPGGGDTEGITLNLPADIAMAVGGAAALDKSLGDTYIAAGAGLKSIMVSIDSSSSEMNEQLVALAAEYDVDFIAGAEIVDNQNVVRLFDSLGQSLSVPAQGDKEYTFPIGNFFNLLQILAGEHRFNLTVTDMNGNTQSGSILITVG